MTNNEGMRSSHNLSSFTVNWATPVEVTAFASVFIIIIQIIFIDKLQEWGFTMTSSDIIVDEDLPNFFTALKLGQADEIILESQNIKENYGFEIEDPRVIDILDLT